jgi:ADP-ribosylglycohydrolase
MNVCLVCFATRTATQRPIDANTLSNKISGSLYGKCIGLVLGQPVEGWTKQEIEKQALLVKAYPITYYFPKDFNSPLKNFLFGNFDSYPPNDDTALMMMGIETLRNFGLDFTSKQLAQTWIGVWVKTTGVRPNA